MGTSASWRRRVRPIPVILAAAAIIVIGNVAYHASTVRANIDVIEWIPNYAGGFVAFGWTTRQPGILVLSELDRDAVDISTHGDVLRTHTRVHVVTPAAQWSAKLYEPHLLLIRADGGMEVLAVNWTRDIFQQLSDVTDCGAGSPGAEPEGKQVINPTQRAPRCGAPLGDLAAFVNTWQGGDVPPAMRRFLARHAAHPGPNEPGPLRGG